jgi:hypothetical protein
MSENGTALISQSEADTYLGCQRKHYYAFGEPNTEGSRGIAAKEHSDSLTRGIIGHEGLASYYTARMNGENHIVGTRQALMTVLSYETTLTDIKAEVVSLLRSYFEYYEEDFDKYQPIAVEREFRYQIPGTGLIFPFKPDAIMRNRETGEVSIWDHKFLYNYYQERIFPLMPQMKKYGYALRQMGFKVDSYLYNQISTRKNTKEPFRRSPVTLHESPAQIFMDEQISTMKKIVWLKGLPDDVWKESIERNAGHFTCSKCPFAELCASDIEGRAGRKILITSDFAPSKYRYEKEDEA